MKKSPIVPSSLILLLTAPCMVSSQTDVGVCPFQVLIWDSDDSCRGPPDSAGHLYPDGECHDASSTLGGSAISGPGNYQAYCDTANNMVTFSASGCKQGCPAAATSTDDDFNTRPICELDASSSSSSSSSTTRAQKWFSIDPANNYSPPLEPHIMDPSMQVASFVCYRVTDEDVSAEGNGVFSYALFGDCSDTTSCADPGAPEVTASSQNENSSGSVPFSTIFHLTVAVMMSMGAPLIQLMI
eukprot:CAMPEP_0194031310 /NCGR_PEP_ID=MMETSP0009_2-20130614/4516_1 /TAXON_ID=210454 /ORGANISM="Grammatophora oceanica, Strain CCMP 410" /LENGTH=241 /DNA_ID=CAMNT_0038671435 /DNA_START=247 /DNA_END=972 /DNA_ORIENTATION=+